MCKALYTDLGIEYQQAYDGPYKDLRCDNLIIAQKDGILSGFGRPVIGDNVKEFERLYGIYPKVWYMDYLEDGKLSEISRFLLKEGIVPKPYYTQIIDLTKSIEELHSDIRKSYQSLSNEKNVHIVSWGVDDDFTQEGRELRDVFTDFKNLHKEIVTFQTRSDLTWDIQKKMVWKGDAFVVYSEGFNSAGLFINNRKQCYYGVGKTRQGFNSHSCLWAAIQHAKFIGCTEFEMGEQVFIGSTKEIGISSFKRGFGGSTRVRLEFKNV